MEWRRPLQESWARSTWPPPHPIRAAPAPSQWLEGSRSVPSMPGSPSSSAAKTRQLPGEMTMEAANVTMKRPAYRFGGHGGDAAKELTVRGADRTLRVLSSSYEELTTGPDADLLCQTHGLPTPLWRSVPFSLEDKSTNLTRSRRTQQLRADKKGNRSHSRLQQWSHAKERPVARYLTDYEFRNAVE
ncbi:unnamed protein product, partial [Prorocentrum cordatum]